MNPENGTLDPRASRRHGFAASLKGGYPFHLGGDWQLEPQAQVIARRSGLTTSTTARPTCARTI
ncbi:autotransporter outer membrane beta-barrel domain-containing protein [Rhizobium laguerreae]|uniref:autotransporter domain-containing protein n=1 Tax=Rhizobium laguerreae TaxID=1076926 RepID=UPI00104D32CE